MHIGRLDGPELSNWLGLNVVSHMGDDLNLGSGGKREAGMWKHMHRCWEDALTKMWGRGRPQDGSEQSGLNHKWMDKPSAEMENKRGRLADFFGLKPEMGSGESRRYSVQRMPFISFYLLISSVFLFVLHCISWEWTPVFSGKKIQLRYNQPFFQAPPQLCEVVQVKILLNFTIKWSHRYRKSRWATRRDQQWDWFQ